MCIVDRYLTYHLRESNGCFSAWYRFSEEQVGKGRSAHCSRMESVENGVGLFDFLPDCQRTACHNHRHKRFPCLCQGGYQFALRSLQMQVG